VTLPQPDLSVRPIRPDQHTPSDAVILTTAFDVFLDEEDEEPEEVSGLHPAMTRSTPTAAIQRVAVILHPFRRGAILRCPTDTLSGPGPPVFHWSDPGWGVVAAELPERYS
jgi:hypothetical protein